MHSVHEIFIWRLQNVLIFVAFMECPGLKSSRTWLLYLRIELKCEALVPPDPSCRNDEDAPADAPHLDLTHSLCIGGNRKRSAFCMPIGRGFWPSTHWTPRSNCACAICNEAFRCHYVSFHSPGSCSLPGGPREKKKACPWDKRHCDKGSRKKHLRR